MEDKIAEEGEENGIVRRIANRVIANARLIADYAVENLPSLIIDDAGNVVWPEAFDALIQRVPNPEEMTVEDVADVLEDMSDRLDMEQLDETIRRIPDWKVKLAVAGGLAAAKTILKLEPEWTRELSEKREKLILQLLQHPSTARAYALLKDRPHLLKFITDYVLLKLGVPIAEPRRPQEGVEVPEKGMDGKGNLVPKGVVRKEDVTRISK